MAFTVLSGSNVDYYDWIVPETTTYQLRRSLPVRTGFDLIGLAVEASQLTTPTSPTVSNLVPANGASIYPSSSLNFYVQDTPAGLFSAIVVHAKFPSGRWDVVYDGANFAPDYSGSSSVSAISLGYSFSVRKTGGWTEAPSLQIIVVDDEGTPIT